MVDVNLTYLYPILDRSGSMLRHVADTCGGFDAFIADQRKQSGRCLVTLAQFNTQYQLVYANKPIEEVPALAMKPNGGTALLDAIGHTITAAGRQLAVLPEDQRPGSVIVPIMTDGEENSSTIYDYDQIASMIKHQTEKYSWLFTYLGANQDAIAEASKLGIGRDHALTFNQGNTIGTFTTLSTATGAYRGARAAGQTYNAAAAAASYTDEQRAEAMAESSPQTP